MSMFVYDGGGGSQGSVYVDKTHMYVSVSENIDCKIKIFARIVHIFTNPIIRDCR